MGKCAKEGTLQAKDVEHFLTAKMDDIDRISRLRFILRLKRWATLARVPFSLDVDIEEEISSIYLKKFALAQNPGLKLRWGRWANRYAREPIDLGSVQSTFGASLISVADDKTELLRKLCEVDSDIHFSFDARCRKASAGGLESFTVEMSPVMRVIAQKFLVGLPRGETEIKFDSWDLAFKTGKGLKPPNQDGVLFSAFSDNSFLVAIADGTGDSNDGTRAVQRCLESLPSAMAGTGDVRISTEIAAAEVRADNMNRKEENSCTLVALHIKKDCVTLVHLSDPFLWIQTDGDGIVWSRQDKASRTNIGGEPFGYTITSSGNRVDTFTSFKESPCAGLDELSGLRSFLIGSDGIFPVREELTASDECPVAVDFEGCEKNPCVVASSCYEAALKSMQVCARGPDNISCVAGYRKW